MLDLLGMVGNYEDRKVAHFDGDDGDMFVDTCSVTDSDQPFETAVEHPRYNGGSMVIVEMYDSKDEAQAGHDKWVKTMTADELPAELRDVSTAGIAQLCRAIGGDDQFISPREGA